MAPPSRWPRSRGLERWDLPCTEAANAWKGTTPRAAKLAAACQILLGDPASAIETVAWLESFDISTCNCDEIRALALLAQGDLTQAHDLIRAHATRGLTGRMRGQICDSALLLAVLAYVEADHDTARHLLLNWASVSSRPRSSTAAT